MKFKATMEKGKFNFGSPEARTSFTEYASKHEGNIFSIELYESMKERRWFEGAVVPMITFYQEGMDHKNPDHNREVREWLKLEFNPEIICIKGISHTIAASTKGQLNKGFVEDVMNWMSDQGYKVEYLLPSMYKDWRDRLFANGGPDNFIDYLVSIKKLP